MGKALSACFLALERKKQLPTRSLFFKVTILERSKMDMNMNSSGGMMSDPDAFCQGPGRVMMPGFQFSFNPTARIENNSCVLWLFAHALVDTSGKYAGAVFGTYVLSLVFELLRAGRARFATGQAPFERFKEGKTSPLTLDVINSVTYMFQVAIAYCIMLLVMLYEAMIFIAIVLGLGTGYFMVLRLNRRFKKHGGAANHDDESEGSTVVKKEASSDSDHNSSEALDATHKAISPCCGEA